MLAAADGAIREDIGTGRSLLHFMVMNGVSDILEAMVEAGFNVNVKDADSITPLHLAVIGNHADDVQTHIERCHTEVHARDLNNALHCITPYI